MLEHARRIKLALIPLFIGGGQTPVKREAILFFLPPAHAGGTSPIGHNGGCLTSFCTPLCARSCGIILPVSIATLTDSCTAKMSSLPEPGARAADGKHPRGAERQTGACHGPYRALANLPKDHSLHAQDARR